MFAIVAHHAGVNDETPAETLSRVLKRYALGLLEMLAAESQEWGTGGPVRIVYRTFSRGTEYLGMAEIQIAIQTSEGAL